MHEALQYLILQEIFYQFKIALNIFSNKYYPFVGKTKSIGGFSPYRDRFNDNLLIWNCKVESRSLARF